MPVTPPPLPSTPSMVCRRHRQSSDAVPPSTRRSCRHLLEPKSASLQSFLFHITEDEDDNFSRYEFSCVDDLSFRRRPNLAAAYGIAQHPLEDQQVKIISAYTLDDGTVYIDSIKLSKKKKKKKEARKDKVKSERPSAHERVPIKEISFCKDSFTARCGTPKRREPKKWEEKEFMDDLEAIMKEIELEKVADVNLNLRSVPHLVGRVDASDESLSGSSSGSSISKRPTKSNAAQMTSTETAVVQVMATYQTKAKKETKKPSWKSRLMSSKKNLKNIRLPSFPRDAGTIPSTKSGKASATQVKSTWLPRIGRTHQLNSSVHTERTTGIDMSGEF